MNIMYYQLIIEWTSEWLLLNTKWTLSAISCREQLSFMWDDDEDDDEDDVDDDDYGWFLLDQHESTICRTRSEHTKPLHVRCG